ncbi:MAG: DUF2330 domain-containing protein [Kiritimatiellae bacterium]|nr:DUF2330 domain-containing protein [Kiritimatiellia bacterium]
MKTTLTIITLSLLTTTAALADGKIYGMERVPPDIPYQRALILFRDGNETLVLQSKIEDKNHSSTETTFGWVIPVPAVPELASMSAEEAHDTFFRLGLVSRPDVTDISSMVLGVAAALLFVAAVACLLLCLLSFAVPSLKSLRAHRGALARFAVYGIFFLLLAGLAMPSFVKARGHAGVDVIKAEDVGIYHMKVIKSTSSADLLDWLKENRFQFSDSDLPTLDQYVRQRWCFVVANVRPGRELGQATRFEGLIDPIILRFPSLSPVYPLALTATTGVNTEVLIYLLADRKMLCGDRLPLLFAGKLFGGPGLLGQDPEKRLVEWEQEVQYLCKFKANLTPEQMKKDLQFAAAPDNEPYRKHDVQW